MSEQFTMSSFVIGLINKVATILVGHATCKATKRYASGGAQIVEKALNQERLDHSAKIIKLNFKNNFKFNNNYESTTKIIQARNSSKK